MKLISSLIHTIRYVCTIPYQLVTAEGAWRVAWVCDTQGLFPRFAAMAECNGSARQQTLNQLNGTEALGRCPVGLGGTPPSTLYQCYLPT